MINLFTGVPGTGKTALAISEMIKLIKEGRPLFVHGIPELKIEHTPIICTSKSCSVCPSDDKAREKMLVADDWHEWAPDGAIVFLDEVQHVYRPRSSSTAPSASIQAFETHRHKGIDFYLISQSPMLFDSNIRRLVNRHIHLRSTWAQRQQFEWPECKDNPTQSTTGAIKSAYTLDKKVFPLYKSSVLHTKIKRKVPAALYAFIGLIVVGGFLINHFYGSVKKRIDPVASVHSLGAGELAEASAAASAPVTHSSQVIENSLDRKPTIKDVPESAPIYANLVAATDFPVISACMLNESTGDCKCYTQQNTLYETSDRICYQFVKGRVFNPYKTLRNEKENNSKWDAVAFNKPNYSHQSPMVYPN